mmetsp:Transcript_8323/g.16941  ORF Transcript_8323/g.16941 Transcript_8323/m.16941 type:complete len:630 (-) Transcript_8323:5024-6913(-)
MYNGIGVPTPRGTGSSGYVQRNLAALPSRLRDPGGARGGLGREGSVKRLLGRVKDPSLVEHERRRGIEVAVVELEEALEERGYSQEEIRERADALRQNLLLEDVPEEEVHGRRGRKDLKASDVHRRADVKEREIRRFGAALGIDPDARRQEQHYFKSKPPRDQAPRPNFGGPPQVEPSDTREVKDEQGTETRNVEASDSSSDISSSLSSSQASVDPSSVHPGGEPREQGSSTLHSIETRMNTEGPAVTSGDNYSAVRSSVEQDAPEDVLIEETALDAPHDHSVLNEKIYATERVQTREVSPVPRYDEGDQAEGNADPSRAKHDLNDNDQRDISVKSLEPQYTARADDEKSFSYQTAIQESSIKPQEGNRDSLGIPNDEEHKHFSYIEDKYQRVPESSREQIKVVQNQRSSLRDAGRGSGPRPRAYPSRQRMRGDERRRRLHTDGGREHHAGLRRGRRRSWSRSLSPTADRRRSRSRSRSPRWPRYRRWSPRGERSRTLDEPRSPVRSPSRSGSPSASRRMSRSRSRALSQSASRSQSGSRSRSRSPSRSRSTSLSPIRPSSGHRSRSRFRSFSRSPEPSSRPGAAPSEPGELPTTHETENTDVLTAAEASLTDSRSVYFAPRKRRHLAN